MFNLSTGLTRLDFNRVENRSFFLALFRHCDVVARKACWRTAFELQKMLLSLDFENDPYATLCTVDYFALKSEQYSWVTDFWNGYKDVKNLEALPNFMYSVALAKWEQKVSIVLLLI